MSDFPDDRWVGVAAMARAHHGHAEGNLDKRLHKVVWSERCGLTRYLARVKERNADGSYVVEFSDGVSSTVQGSQIQEASDILTQEMQMDLTSLQCKYATVCYWDVDSWHAYCYFLRYFTALHVLPKTLVLNVIGEYIRRPHSELCEVYEAYQRGFYDNFNVKLLDLRYMEFLTEGVFFQLEHAVKLLQEYKSLVGLTKGLDCCPIRFKKSDEKVTWGRIVNSNCELKIWVAIPPMSMANLVTFVDGFREKCEGHYKESLDWKNRLIRGRDLRKSVINKWQLSEIQDSFKWWEPQDTDEIWETVPYALEWYQRLLTLETPAYDAAAASSDRIGFRLMPLSVIAPSPPVTDDGKGFIHIWESTPPEIVADYIETHHYRLESEKKRFHSLYEKMDMVMRKVIRLYPLAVSYKQNKEWYLKTPNVDQIIVAFERLLDHHPYISQHVSFKNDLPIWIVPPEFLTPKGDLCAYSIDSDIFLLPTDFCPEKLSSESRHSRPTSSSTINQHIQPPFDSLFRLIGETIGVGFWRGLVRF